MKIVAENFGFQYPMPDEVKRMDSAALEFEWDNKMLADTFVSMTPRQAKEKFLNLFHKYSAPQFATLLPKHLS